MTKVAKTVGKCKRKLEGNFGFKRFLRDGAGHRLEDSRKPFYNSSEVKDFDGTENEYPVYFCYMVINSVFAGDLAEAKRYFEMVQTLCRRTRECGTTILPYFYCVPEECIEQERLKPNSQIRVASREIDRNSSHLWTQAIWIICQLLGWFITNSHPFISCNSKKSCFFENLFVESTGLLFYFFQEHMLEKLNQYRDILYLVLFIYHYKTKLTFCSIFIRILDFFFNLHPLLQF